MDYPITVITPAIGTEKIFRLLESMEEQSVSCVHIVLWDKKRADGFEDPSVALKRFSNGKHLRYHIQIPGTFVKGTAFGSSLRSIGLMAADTEYVTFADEDVWYKDNHLEKMISQVDGSNWGYCKRQIYKQENNGSLTWLGVDNFESVGDSPSRKVPYEMVDNNVMIFKRRYGTSAAVLYRETEEYNDDRLMYSFLKKHAGMPFVLNEANVCQICPSRLEKMFETYCEK